MALPPPASSPSPAALRFRLVDDEGWRNPPWAAHDAGSLAAGVRMAWDAWTADRPAPLRRTVLDLRRRMDEIDAWLKARSERPGATDAARVSWAGQVASWRAQAARRYGGLPPLHLQMESCATGTWFAPFLVEAAASALLSSSAVTPAQLERAGTWGSCRRAWEADDARRRAGVGPVPGVQ